MIASQSTEIGAVPSDWEVKTIAELIENGSIIGHLDGNHGDLYPRSHEFKAFGVPYVGANDFVNGHVSFDECKFLGAERASRFRKGIAINGDVLFAHNATVGPVAMLSTELPYVILSTTATYYRCNSEKLVNWYVLGALQAPYFVRQYRAVMAQSTRFQVPITAQRKFFLAVPPPAEQRAIAEALSDVDALLGVLDRMLTKKRDLKQAAMQQLLTGKTRLPGFKGEWEEKTVLQLADGRKDLFDDGDWIEAEHITEQGIRLIQTGNIGVGEFKEKSNRKYINEKSFAKLRCKPLEVGDLLVCRLADPAGRACVLPDIGETRMITSVDVTIFRPLDTRANRVYLANLFSTRDWFRQIENASGGTTRKRIARGALGKCSINLPSAKEQTAIAEVLSDMDAEIAALERRREKTQDLKQGMMQELLTGKTRLIN